MTMIVDRRRTGPQTHALVIGVGHYPYLHDPDKRAYRDALPADLRNLDPLPSAPLSALEIVRWLREEYNNPNAPLGTIECLLSDSAGPVSVNDDDGRPVDVERASIDNIRFVSPESPGAFRRWFDRCHSNEKNVALFYFCGHGFMKTISALLTDDFGRDALDPFTDAINFDGMENGMRCCQASTQLFFADACRQVPRTALQMINDLPARTFVQPIPTAFHVRRMLRASAAVPNTQAHTRLGEVTQFTRGLLQGLRGEGSERMSGDKWVVTLSGLNTAIDDAVQRMLLEPGTPDQTCEIRAEGAARVGFHVLSGKPVVPVRIGCRPESMMGSAKLILSKLDDSTVISRRDHPQARPWECAVTPDRYVVAADFGAAHSTAKVEIWAIPPSVIEDLEVTV